MKLFKRSVELVVIRDYLNPQNGMEFYQGDCIEKLLKLAFGASGLSSSIKIYHNNIAQDVTPKTPQDVDKLMRLNGRFCAVVKPMGLDPVSWVIIGISVLASVAVAFLMPMPTMDNSAANQPPSPNNALAARTNKQRLGGRIPDIYGTVWSTPDLIAPVYSVYIDHEEVEYSYMCIGRGRFNVMRAYDDTSDVTQMAGTTVQIYEPNANISTSEPIKQFGANMTPREKVLSKLAVKRYTAVNGQVLESPEVVPLGGNYSMTFTSPNTITVSGGSPLSETVAVGQSIVLSTTGSAQSVNMREGETFYRNFDFSGTYVVSSVTANQITLQNPHLVRGSWAAFAETVDSTVPVNGAIRGTSSTGADDKWQGPFYIDDPDSDGVMINFVAPNGIYTVHPDGDKFAPFDVAMEVKFEALNEDNDPIAGSTALEYRKIAGRGAALNAEGTIFQLTTDDEARRSAAATHFFYRSGRQRVWIRRFSKENVPNPPQQYFEEVRIKDLYSYQLITSNKAAAANTTRVYVKTIATEGALSLKERKLRLLVQRYVTDATSGLPKLSNRADDILRHVATDPKIGNLQLTQVDIAQIKTEIDAQIAYFGTDKCSQFCGTFDDNNLSAEETMQIVAKAVFSQAKRQGNKIMLDFERKVPASVAVFNSHNILPDTFTAPQSLGIANDYDGVKIEYTDPIDDAIITMSYPNDAITNPHEDKLIGVRNKVQAHTHMMRMYNKDRHAYKSCEFVAGDESNIVVRTNRITVADQLRADVQQGSVDSIETISGDIVLHTTDPVTIEPTGAYTMFIQTINNGVESIAVAARDSTSVKLARLPSGEISGADRVVQAAYQIVSETDDNRDAYLVAQKDPSDGMTNKLLCTNYDDRYYQNDSDFIDGLITVN